MVHLGIVKNRDPKEVALSEIGKLNIVLTASAELAAQFQGPLTILINPFAGDNRYHAILEGKRCFAVCPSDTAIALSALDAKISVQGKGGERIIPIKDFFITMGNVLSPDEIVKEIKVPKPPKEGKQTFLKFRLRKAIDFAIVSVAAVTTVKDGVCQDAKIALGAVAPTPIRATKAEEALKGKTINTTTAEAAAKAAVAGVTPLSMNAYKVEITKALVKRAILT